MKMALSFTSKNKYLTNNYMGKQMPFNLKTLFYFVAYWNHLLLSKLKNKKICFLPISQKARIFLHLKHLVVHEKLKSVTAKDMRELVFINFNILEHDKLKKSKNINLRLNQTSKNLFRNSSPSPLAPPCHISEAKMC